MRIGSAIFVLAFGATILAAQNASTIPAQRNKSEHVRESVLKSNRDRMTWEASQLSSIPIMQSADPAEHQAIHIDQPHQPSPALPTVRRELLTPTDSVSKGQSEK
jgi:hypothetical protein